MAAARRWGRGTGGSRRPTLPTHPFSVRSSRRTESSPRGPTLPVCWPSPASASPSLAQAARAAEAVAKAARRRPPRAVPCSTRLRDDAPWAIGRPHGFERRPRRRAMTSAANGSPAVPHIDPKGRPITLQPQPPTTSGSGALPDVVSVPDSSPTPEWPWPLGPAPASVDPTRTVVPPSSAEPESTTAVLVPPVEPSCAAPVEESWLPPSSTVTGQ